MKAILSAFLFLMISTAAFAAGIEGNWTTKVKSPDGNEMEISYVFKMDGEKLTGFIKTPNGDMAISNTKIEDKVFSFDISFNGMDMKHECTLKDDDTISVKIVGSPMGDREMILKRQK